MIDNSFERYFTFWFAHFANGFDKRTVYITEKDYYTRTKDAAIKHGPISERSDLKNKVKEILNTIN